MIDLSLPWQVIEGESLALLRALPNGCVDALVTDPPYSSGGTFRGDRAQRGATEKYQRGGLDIVRPEFGGDNRDQRAYGYWCSLWLSECLRVAVQGAPAVLFTDWRQLPTTTDALQSGGWVWRGIVPWDKTEAARPDMGRFRNQAEYAVWGSSGPMAQSVAVGCLPGVFRVGVRQDDKHHVTGKPTELMRNLVSICEPGGLILDPFCGSGSTGVAAIQEGYRFIGIEREPAYVAIARQRIADAAAQGNLFADGAA